MSSENKPEISNEELCVKICPIMVEADQKILAIPSIDMEAGRRRLENAFLGIHSLLLEDENYYCGQIIPAQQNIKPHFIFLIQEQVVICTLGPIIDLGAKFDESRSQSTYPSQELQQLVEKLGVTLAVDARLKSNTSFEDGQRQVAEVKYQIR